jgi:hypothetical protein
VDGIAKSEDSDKSRGMLTVHTWCKRRFCVHGTFEIDRMPAPGKTTWSP